MVSPVSLHNMLFSSGNELAVHLALAIKHKHNCEKR